MPTASPSFGDARLLFEAFTASPWRRLDVAHGAMHLSISRLPPEKPGDLSSRDPPADVIELRAPFLATLREVAAPGSIIARGDVYAVLELLDELIELRSPEKIEIIHSHIKSGEILEFAKSIVSATIMVTH